MVVATQEIDAATGDDFWMELAPQLPSRAGDALVVDLRDVRFMASTGISVLLRANAEARRCGGRVDLVNAQPPVARLLELTGVDELFRLPLDPAGADDSDDALA